MNYFQSGQNVFGYLFQFGFVFDFSLPLLDLLLQPLTVLHKLHNNDDFIFILSIRLDLHDEIGVKNSLYRTLLSGLVELLVAENFRLF